MIIVDIKIPSVESVYDFKLDENTQTKEIVNEIIKLVEQRENCVIDDHEGSMLLSLPRSEKILDKDKTLYENGIVSGDQLLLV